VIGDGIESFGAEYKGNKVGNTATDITCFSFQPVRLPTTVDGGAIAFNSKEKYERAVLMRDYGIDRTKFRDSLGEIAPNCDIKSIGYNALMNEISGYIGSCQMDHLQDLLRKQQENGALCKRLLSERGFECINATHGSNPNYWVFSLFDDSPIERIRDFRSKGIYASKVHFRNDQYSCFGSEVMSLKGVDEFNRRVVSIPSGWWVTAANLTEALK
jgi:perosamine synthetase